MRYLVVLFGVALAGLGGCSSAPSAHDIETVYRFENLRKDVAQPAKGGVSKDEWATIRPILEKASARKIEVSRSGVRAYGAVELANYECRCVLRSLDDFVRVQSELEALSGGDDGERIETHLTQLGATYKSNFVLATVSVGVSGATAPGYRVRVYAAPGEAPVETMANYNGIWSAKVAIVPQSTWIYGVSEDPKGVVPPQYFRINATTRKQERVDEAEFVKQFPTAPPPGKAGNPGAGAPVTPANEEQRLRQQREKEDEAFRKRREEDDKRHGGTGSP
jgi:hypothetical protein